jgi:putative inorganic carbon (HCO3(-)) transporter
MPLAEYGISFYNTQHMSFDFLIRFFYHGLFLVTPLFFVWGNSELFELNKMLLVYSITTIIAFLWVARCIFEKKWLWKNHLLVTFLLVFLASQALSTFLSIHWHTSLFGYYSRLNGGFFSSLSYVILALGIWNNIPPQKRLSLLLTHALGLLFVSLYAIPEHFGVSPSCYFFHQKFDISCWRQDVQSRIFGTFGQPNWLASYIVGTLPLVVFVRSLYPGKMRLFWTVALFLSLTTLWFTHSRSGIIAMVILGGFSAVLWGYKHWKPLQKALSHRLFLPFLGLFAIVGSITGSLFLYQRTLSDLNHLDLSQGTDSFSIRTLVWQGALSVWQRYPLFGSGPATFAYSFYLDRPALHNLVSEWDFLYNKAHNEFLNTLSETGAVGLISYCLYLFAALFFLWKKGQSLRSWSNSAWMVLLSMIGLSIVHFFGFSIVMTNVLLFTLPFIVLGKEEEKLPALPQKKSLQKKKLSSVSSFQELSLWRYVLLVVAGISGMMVLASIARFWQADRWYKKSEEQQKESLYREAAQSLQKAIDFSPREALFYDEFSNVYSILSFQYAVLGQQETSEKLADAAIENSNYALLLNPRHLNFYRTRVRTFLILAQNEPRYFVDAEHTLRTALELAPTDAKLWYNLGLVYEEEHQWKEAQEALEKAVFLKPNYLKARETLASLYAETHQPTLALEQLQFILNHLSVNDPFFQKMYDDVEATASAQP